MSVFTICPVRAGSIPPDVVEWRRICTKELAGCTAPQTFKDGASAGDVVQGQLGNCWFVSALSGALTPASTAWATLLLQLRAFALGFDASLPRRRRRRGRDGQCLMSVVVGVCLPVLATDQRYVQRVFVSDQNRAKGIYTLKFYKQGQVGGRCRWVACAFWWTG